MVNMPPPFEIREMSERLRSRRALFDSTHDSHLFADLMYLLKRLGAVQQEDSRD